MPEGGVGDLEVGGSELGEEAVEGEECLLAREALEGEDERGIILEGGR